MAVEVGWVKLHVGYVHYRKVRKLPANKNARHEYLKFLGVVNPTTAFAEVPLMLPEGVLRKIEWLSGPNSEVMYKIWKAQHEQEER